MSEYVPYVETDDLVTADPRNRMQPLPLNAETGITYQPELYRGDLPYVETAREVRSKLRASLVNTEGNTEWPPVPEFDSIEALFEAAKDEVDARWQAHVRSVVDAKLVEWLPRIPEDSRYDHLRNTLNNPAEVEQRLRIQRLENLEDLQSILPEVWYALLHLQHEHLMAGASLVRHWLQQIKSDNQKSDQLKNAGMTVEELKVMLDLHGLTAKHFDHAFIKQLDFTAQVKSQGQLLPSRKRPDEQGKELEVKGDRFFYRFGPDQDHAHEQTFRETFPTEMPRIVQNLHRMADRVEAMVQQHVLPPSYEELSIFLHRVAITYGSMSTDPDRLYDLYQEKLDQAAADLVASGCPILLTPQTISGVGGRTEFDMRMGIRTPNTRKLDELLDDHWRHYREFHDQHRDHFGKWYEMPNSTMNYQPFAHGSNLMVTTRGQSSRKLIVNHVDDIRAASLVHDLPLLKRVMADEIDEETYLEAVIQDTALHEGSHMVDSRYDAQGIGKRVSLSRKCTALEETKAETFSLWPLARLDEEGELPEDELEKFLTAKLGGALYNLQQKSMEPDTGGEPYFLSGLAVCRALLQSGALVREGDKYRIADARKGVRALADLGEEIYRTFYFNEESTVENAEAYAVGMREYLKEEDVKALVDLVRQKQ